MGSEGQDELKRFLSSSTLLRHEAAFMENGYDCNEMLLLLNEDEMRSWGEQVHETSSLLHPAPRILHAVRI